MKFEPLTALRAMRSPAGDGLAAPAFAVFAVLVTHADGGGVAWPSLDLLAVEAKVARSTASQAVKALEAAGWLKREYRATPTGRVVSYTLTPKPEVARVAMDRPARGPSGSSASRTVRQSDHGGDRPAPGFGSSGSRLTHGPAPGPDLPIRTAHELPIPPTPHGGEDDGRGFAPVPTAPASSRSSARTRSRKPSRMDAPKEKSAKERYAEAYAQGQTDASGEPYAPPRACQPLIDAARWHASDLRADDLLAWLRRSSAEYRRARATAAQYEQGFSPAKFLEWLKSGRCSEGPSHSRVWLQPPAAVPMYVTNYADLSDDSEIITPENGMP